jgi:hypothetical protein
MKIGIRLRVTHQCLVHLIGLKMGALGRLMLEAGYTRADIRVDGVCARHRLYRIVQQRNGSAFGLGNFDCLWMISSFERSLGEAMVQCAPSCAAVSISEWQTDCCRRRRR